MYCEPFIWDAENHPDEYFNFLVHSEALMSLQLLGVEHVDKEFVLSVVAGVLRTARFPSSSTGGVSFRDQRPAGGPGCGQGGFSESWECLSEQGVAIGTATKLFLSFSPPSPPLSLPLLIKMKTIG